MDLNLVSEVIGQDDQRWLGGSHGTGGADSVTLDAALFTAGTHYPNGYLPSGTVLAQNTSTLRYGPYTTGGSLGSGTAAGLLLTPIKINSGTSTPSGPIMWHGEVVAAFLPFTSGAGSIDATGKGQLPLLHFR